MSLSLKDCYDLIDDMTDYHLTNFGATNYQPSDSRLKKLYENNIKDLSSRRETKNEKDNNITCEFQAQCQDRLRHDADDYQHRSGKIIKDIKEVLKEHDNGDSNEQKYKRDVQDEIDTLTQNAKAERKSTIASYKLTAKELCRKYPHEQNAIIDKLSTAQDVTSDAYKKITDFLEKELSKIYENRDEMWHLLFARFRTANSVITNFASDSD